VQDKLKAKIEQLEKERADLQQQIAALEAASSAPKAESDAPAGPAVDELVKQHQEELQAQALRLKAEANEALNAAVEAAKVGAAPSGTAYTEEDIAAAVERGRKELGAKLKIKDSQLSNMQAKLKTLEQQMLQLSNIDKAGTVTATAPAAAGAAATAAKPITRKASMAAAGAPVAPAAAAAAAAAGPSAGPAGAGRGRGQGQPARGAKAPRQLGGRGGGASGGPAGAAAADSNGLSISGAAAKRAREETGTASDDSLAKRLRPAPADAAGKAPVAIRRTPANP
jgi:nucleoprotein TPR